jgi:hypothetical protein
MKTIVSFVDCDAPYTYRDEFGNVDGYVINKDGDVYDNAAQKTTTHNWNFIEWIMMNDVIAGWSDVNHFWFIYNGASCSHDELYEHYLNSLKK